METQTFVEYELTNLVSDRHVITDSREEALSCFDEGWVVTEHHITVCKQTTFASTRQTVSVTWNDNPEFERG